MNVKHFRFQIPAWIGILLCGCGDGGTVPVPEKPLTLIHAPGYLEPEGRLRRLVFERSGVIERITAEEGARVLEGEELARLVSEREESELRTREKELALAEAELRLLRSGEHPDRLRELEEELARAKEEEIFLTGESERLGKAMAKNSVSGTDRERGRHLATAAGARARAAAAALTAAVNKVRPEQLATATAAVEVAEMKTRAAREEVRRGILRARSNGRVLEVFVRAGEHAAQEPVLLFAPDGPWMVRAEVDAGYLEMVRPGLKVTVRDKGWNGRAVQGVIQTLKPVMGRKRLFTREAQERMDLQVFEVLARLTESPAAWPAGMEVEVGIIPDTVP